MAPPCLAVLTLISWLQITSHHLILLIFKLIFPGAIIIFIYWSYMNWQDRTLCSAICNLKILLSDPRCVSFFFVSHPCNHFYFGGPPSVDQHLRHGNALGIVWGEVGCTQGASAYLWMKVPGFQWALNQYAARSLWVWRSPGSGTLG